MTKTIKSIDVPGSFEMRGKKYIRIQFNFFREDPSEIFNVEIDTWTKILKMAKAVASSMPISELNKEIYYAVVMGTAEFNLHA